MKHPLFTIVFMITITIFFVSLLAVVNEYSQERIQRNLMMQRNQSILYAFDMLPEGLNDDQLSSNLTTE